jgi:hypothetical protein
VSTKERRKLKNAFMYNSSLILYVYSFVILVVSILIKCSNYKNGFSFVRRFALIIYRFTNITVILLSIWAVYILVKLTYFRVKRGEKYDMFKENLEKLLSKQ